MNFVVSRARQWRRCAIEKGGEPGRAQMDIDPMGPDINAVDQGGQEGTLCVLGNTVQLLPISPARAMSRRCADGSGSRVDW